MADLNADIEHDLRDRMRDIMRLAEEEIEQNGDPTKIWEQLRGWAEQQVAAAVSANFLWATQRAQWLAGQVAEHFSEDAGGGAARCCTPRPPTRWHRSGR